MLWFLSPSPPPPSPVNKLDRRNTGRLRKRDKLLVGEVAISFDGEKAWSSLYHSILSGGIGSLNLTMQQIRPLHSNRAVAVRLHPVLSRSTSINFGDNRIISISNTNSQGCGSGMFIPYPNFSIPDPGLKRICIPDPHPHKRI